MDMPFKSASEITAMAASCFPRARAAATGIDHDVLDPGAPKPKQEAKKLAALLRPGKIFDKGILAMLHELVGLLDAEGTYVETRYDHSPENVSDYKTWGQERLTPEADRLTKRPRSADRALRHPLGGARYPARREGPGGAALRSLMRHAGRNTRVRARRRTYCCYRCWRARQRDARAGLTCTGSTITRESSGLAGLSVFGVHSRRRYQWPLQT